MAYNKETGMWEGFIYKITDDINNKIYIGQTRQTADLRFKQHLRAWRKTDNSSIPYVDIIIGKLGAEHFTYEVLKKIVDKDKDHLVMLLKKYEKYYIKKYKSNCSEYGYNISAGGDDYGVFNKPVWQYTLDGVFIQEFGSLTIAAQSVGTDKATIGHCCKKDRGASAKGYLWSYAGETYRTDIYYKNRNVDMYDSQGCLLQSFDNVNAITTDKKMRRKIRDCCEGYKYNIDGFVYRYKGDDFNKYPVNYKKRGKSVGQFDLSNNLIKVFPSLKSVKEELNNSTIGDVILKGSCIINGYMWRYI